MKQVLQNDRSRELQVVDVPSPPVLAGSVLVRNVTSLISAGTERMAVEFGRKSLLDKARSRPDLVRQVIGRAQREGIRPTLEAIFDRLEQPVPLGYSSAGVVQEVGAGAEEFTTGQRVACAGAGYANHAEFVTVPRNLVVALPDRVGFDDAAYVTLGAIALHGVRTTDPRFGEAVAVIGLGVLGQLSVQILKAAGCRVLAVDLEPDKVTLARELGADAAILRSQSVHAVAAELTGGIGLDAVVVTAATTSSDPLELAGEICRDRGRVCIVGAVGMQLPRETYYRKELDLRVSRSYGPGRYDHEYEERGLDYPVGYVRWTERRNLAEFLRLVEAGQITPSRLTTHRFGIDEAPTAYQLITGDRKEPYLGILLTYSAQTAPVTRVIELRQPPPHATSGGKLGIGVIGAGSFGKAVILPRLSRNTNVRLVGISTATGASARATGARFGFEFCSTDPSEIFASADIGAVVIMTRHSSHAHYVRQALQAEKAVFVEKPLALNETELDAVLLAQRASGQILTVGFNRRFAPLALTLRDAFEDAGPLAIHYRINAGPLPAGHWIYDRVEGGGRIVGEVCHFVDFVQFLTGASVEEVFAYALGGSQGVQQDSVAIALRLSGGGVASIDYFATGDKSVPKERLEVFGGGAIGVLDDFRALSLTRQGKTRRIKSRVQDKGFDCELQAFVRAAREGGQTQISMDSLEVTARTTFAIVESLRTGRPVGVARKEPLSSES